MESLPEEADAEAYDKLPIADFGEAYMRGLGWTKGQGVGRRQVGPAIPYVFLQRAHRLGLGAEQAAPEVPPCPFLSACPFLPSVQWFAWFTAELSESYFYFRITSISAPAFQAMNMLRRQKAVDRISSCDVSQVDVETYWQQEKRTRHVKPGESRQEKQHQVFIDKDGRQKHVVTLDDKLVDAVRLGVHPGKTMHILGGRHEGLACEVRHGTIFHSRILGFGLLQIRTTTSLPYLGATVLALGRLQSLTCMFDFESQASQSRHARS